MAFSDRRHVRKMRTLLMNTCENMALEYLYFTMVISVILAMSSGRYTPTADVSAEACVDEAYQFWLKTMLNQFIGLADMTASMVSSRRLFDMFLLQKMNTSTVKEYCKAHRYARANFNRCDNSTYKKMVVSNFGLADYICIIRVGDYGRYLGCLGAVYEWASALCKPNCSEYQPILPNDKVGINYDIMSAMAADCSYLKCMVTCRYPHFKWDCGEEAASLEIDALYTTFSTTWDLYEPVEVRELLENGFYSPYPSECRELANGEGLASFISPKPEQEHSETASEPTAESRKVRMLLAVSSSTITNSDSLMCEFGNHVQQFFTSFCPNGFSQRIDGDFVSVTVSIQ